jgi:acetolactate synthase small subunit
MLKPLTFVISAENHPDLLARTVLLFHRLAVPIHGLIMQRPEEAPHMRITVHVLAEPDQSDRIAAQLAKLVHVIWVETRRARRQSRLRHLRYAVVRLFA